MGSAPPSPSPSTSATSPSVLPPETASKAITAWQPAAELLEASNREEALQLVQQPSCMHMTEQRVQAATPAEVSSTLWAYAALGRPPPEALQGLLWRALMRVLLQMKPRHLATTLLALGSSGWQLGHVSRDALQLALLSTLPRMTAADIATSLEGWSMLGWELEGDLAAAASQGVGQLVEQAGPEELPAVIHAYASLPAAWRDSTHGMWLQLELEERLSSMGPAEVASAVQAAGRLGSCNWLVKQEVEEGAVQRTALGMQPAEVCGVLGELARRCREPGSLWNAPSQQVQVALQAALVRTLPSMEQQQAASSLQSWAHLGWQLDAQLAAAAAEVVGASLPQAVNVSVVAAGTAAVAVCEACLAGNEELA